MPVGTVLPSNDYRAPEAVLTFVSYMQVTCYLIVPTSFCAPRQLPGQLLVFNLNNFFFYSGDVLKYISCKQVNIETSKELVEKNCYSVIAALVIILAKLEETNEEYFENIIHLLYLIP